MREAFERDGFVRVAGAIAEADVRAMGACVREKIAAVELVEIAGARRPQRGFELALWAIGREPAFAPLPDALARAVDGVFDRGAWVQVEGEAGGYAMPNLPCAGATWSACEAAWHVDEPTPPDGAPSGVLLAYAFLDRVERGGGATVALEGSPRRLAEIAKRRGTTLLHTEAYGAFVEDGRQLPEVELIGEPGDLVLLDPRCLHTISANVSTRPRLIMRLTCRPGARARSRLPSAAPGVNRGHV